MDLLEKLLYEMRASDSYVNGIFPSLYYVIINEIEETVTVISRMSARYSEVKLFNAVFNTRKEDLSLNVDLSPTKSEAQALILHPAVQSGRRYSALSLREILQLELLV
ncbi:hypothetical protein ACTFIR_011933 [Dictyostelium discoideum]